MLGEFHHQRESVAVPRSDHVDARGGQGADSVRAGGKVFETCQGQLRVTTCGQELSQDLRRRVTVEIDRAAIDRLL